MVAALGASRKLWKRRSHESAVERFYSRGVHGETEIHRGYLNFGLWEDGIEDYVEAAEALVRRLGEEVGLGPRARLLDVGCGTGTQDIYLQRRFGPLQIDAVDVTWPHVERARRRARADGFAHCVRFHHGSATRLSFPDGTFTQLIGIEGPVHFLTRRAFFDEAHRVLAAGGVMGLADYALVRRPRGAIENALFDVARALWKVPRENVCTTEEYQEQLLAAGFCDVRVESFGPRTFPGYYREQRRPDFRREMERLQGKLLARVGTLINRAAYRAYEIGLVDYLLVRAAKGGTR